MLLLGLLSIIQTIVLPGFIIVNFFQLNIKTVIQKWIYIFAFSLFINYSIVTILTFLSLYKPSVVFLIIFIEIILIAYLILKKRIAFKDMTFNALFSNYFTFQKTLSSTNRFLLIMAGVIILFYFTLIIANLGTVFYFVDTVNNIHWNTWAKDFANNMFPQHSSHFPQLIPSNWSLSYVITGSPDINFFPKAFMPLFFFGNILMFLDLALSERRSTYLAAIIIYGLIAPIIYSLVFMADGNADLPVSFFALLAFYTYLKRDKNKFNIIDYLLVFLFASTAAGTKLAGSYILAFMSILLLYHLIKNWKLITGRELFFIFLFIAAIISINMFWYFYQPEVMYQGLDQPEYLREGLLNIILHAVQLIYFNLGAPVVLFLLLTGFFSLFDKQARFITLFLVLPPILIWSAKFSVDLRNLSFVVPFLSYISAFGLFKLIEIVSRKKFDDSLTISSYKNSEQNYKVKWGIISIISFVLFLLMQTDFVYQGMLNIYRFAGILYFQSNKINLLVDYTPFVNVNYYHNVISVMLILIPLLYILYILKVKIKHFVLVLSSVAVFLNFTYLQKEDIAAHHKNEIERIEARNYYFFLKTMIAATPENKVFTNFKLLVTEPIPKEIDFVYINADQIISSIQTDTLKYPVLLKINGLNQEMGKKIIQNIMQKNYKVYFNDGDYIFFGME